ncbi:MAG: S1 RNA-binding domain-containing protein, partial [Desulfobacterales bacterium]|nr:S1 RNA-binding domain-containing protein [Desulfobacterales bacterium]
MKQLTDDPWSVAAEKYAIGTRVAGKVVSLTDYGAFIELEEGVEGLIHVSEMSWTRKIRHPSKMVSTGEIVDAVVLDIMPDNRRISLGMKQIVPNPWEVISDKYPVGTIIEGKIKNITDFGLFLGIDDDIDGLVHISDISWTKRIKHPSEVYKKGDVLQAKVLDIDKGSERFSLGVKQLEPDPWESVKERYAVGKEISGTVTNVTDFGVFVELEEGIEGLIHVSEISKEKIKTPVGQYNISDEITAKVMNVNTTERRIGLSIKRLEMDDNQAMLKEYVNNMKPARSSFGEILRDNLQEKIISDEAATAPEMPIDSSEKKEEPEVSPEVETETAPEMPIESSETKEEPETSPEVETEAAPEIPIESSETKEEPEISPEVETETAPEIPIESSEAIDEPVEKKADEDTDAEAVEKAE